MASCVANAKDIYSASECSTDILSEVEAMEVDLEVPKFGKQRKKYLILDACHMVKSRVETFVPIRRVFNTYNNAGSTCSPLGRAQP
ncbi:hypothetical protein D910_04839 [Dendroctonus ponderosae]|uniref:Uncharacterized protein n=1 Tax=Dendroctonus ponderosae TaxID=77166 RepID=U4U323_DENPD|nr:hypothetical protein D910_04839 [Dendroctonus ponderosae]